MTEDRLQQLFHEATELDAPDRERFLTDVARDFPDLLGELERLLAAPASEVSPIDGSARRASGAARPAPSPVPERVGRFRILRELGRGGMGQVFLAEEESDHFQRTVALKLIHDPGPGTDAIRRFRDEVRILAALEHPNIARFLDGGCSPEGVWYLALEYVDGTDLVEHARAAALGARQRVELFAAVVEAVAYAHGRGVVHRDLKPTNLIVGGDGRPRLLDFGISKLVDPGVEAGATTATDWRPLTPAYASPEQLLGERASPRSDVYSLGVVFYELLTGDRPFASAGSGRAALERAVREREPVPPSVAARHSTQTSDPDRPRGRPAAGAGIDRDLDAICLRALRRRPEERYDGASALLDDLRRYLAGQAVAARTGGGALGLGRRLGRLRGWRIVAAALVLAAAGVTVALLAGRSRGAPEASPPTAASATRFFPFDPANPPPAADSERRLADAPEDFVAGAALVFRLAREGRLDEAGIVVGRMRQVPGQEREPLIDYAEGRIASVGGEDQRALVFYTRARDLALAEGRGELLGALRTSRAATLSKLGQRTASLAELEAARQDSERIGDHRTLYRTLNGLALEHLQRGEMAQGAKDLEDALAAAQIANLEPIVTLENLAVVRAIQGRPDLAEPLARRLLDHYHRADRPSDEGEVSRNLALMVRDLGRVEEAATLLERSRELLRVSHHGNDIGDTLHAQAVLHLDAGRLDRVAPLIAELEATAKESLKWLPLGHAHWLRGRLAVLAGDLGAARVEFAEARKLFLAGGDRDRAALFDLSWAEAEAAAGDSAAALRIVAEGLGALDQTAGTEAGYFAEALRARIEAGAGSVASARERLLALGPEAERSPSLGRRLAFVSARAAVTAAEGRADAARADLEAALDLADRTGRKLTGLELRLELARLALPAAAARGAAREVQRDAAALGYAALAGRAAALSGG